MSNASRYYIVFGNFLLEHEPHGANVIARKAPITLDIEIAHLEFFLQAQLDASHAMTDSTGHKFNTATRRFMIEENAGACKQVVALAGIHGDPMSVQLRNSIGASGIKPCALVLRGLLSHAEHFAGGCLIKTNRGIDNSNCFQHSRDAQRGELPG